MSSEEYLKRGDFDFCLAHVIEECGEVLAAAGKTQRWGRKSVDPTLKEQYQETNEKWLLRELDDLEEAIVRLREIMTTPLGEPRTTDYCSFCGHSPQSAVHLGHGNEGHGYVDPRKGK